MTLISPSGSLTHAAQPVMPEKSSLRVSAISRALGDESGSVAETVSLLKTLYTAFIENRPDVDGILERDSDAFPFQNLDSILPGLNAVYSNNAV